jgi:hypothetical protein
VRLIALATLDRKILVHLAVFNRELRPLLVSDSDDLLRVEVRALMFKLLSNFLGKINKSREGTFWSTELVLNSGGKFTDLLTLIYLLSNLMFIIVAHLFSSWVLRFQF